MSLEELERRIKALEDVEEIKRLKRRYCAYCDDNYDADALAGLFTEDAVWDGGIRGKSVGREEIRRFFKDAPQRLPFAIHMVLNPIIEVDGDRAEGTWYLFQPCTFADGNRAMWGAARYDEVYVRVDGEWKFQSLKLTSRFWTPFDEGWVKTRFA
jgi:ketosteroid isomerase-like protein